MRLPSELEVMQLSPAKVERVFGLTPQVSLREGLKREWEWLLENRGRWTTMSY
jgi:nucleoside-diphosphate-sugar epimerase